MREPHSPFPNSDAPVLFNTDIFHVGLLEHLRTQMRNVTNEADLFQVLIEAIEKADCRFLFEIPASLFEFPNGKAAAIVHFSETGKAQLCFLACNLSSGTIQLLSDAEAGHEVLEFVDSYACVLQSLGGIRIEQKLHS